MRDLKAALRWGLVATAWVVCVSVRAAEPQPGESAPRDSLRYEFAPFIGYRMAGSFTMAGTGQHADLDDHGSFAIALGLAWDDVSQYELLYARQSTVLRSGATLVPTGIAIEYLHVGGTVLLDDEWPVKPYLGGGLGITRFSPDPPIAHENTRFSASLALGLRVPLSRHFTLRTEARGYLTFVNPDTAFFCRSDGGLLCRIHSRGSTFSQYDLLVGAAYDF